MRIYKGYAYRLKPTAAQEQLLLQHSGVCRLVYNLALEQRRDWWRQYQNTTGDNLNYVTQARQLTDLRREFDFIREVSQTAQQRALKALDTAFKNFFAGRARFPKPRKKGAGDAFSYHAREVKIERLNANWSRVWLPKVGWVRFRSTRPVVGEPKDVTVTRNALGWQVSIGALVEADIAPSNLPAVGVDRGITVPLQLSDGTSYTLPKSLERLERLHRRAQRIASRRKRGSNRHRKAVRRAANIKARQTRIRRDWAHRSTTEIVRLNGTVVIERLRTKNMSSSARGTADAPGRGVSQKRGLNRAILNVGWHQIEAMLAYKLTYAGGSLIKVAPAYTSQTCAACGTVDSRSRKSQASFVCTECGHRSNADLNAAINILNRGNTAVLDVEDGHRLSVEASTHKAA